MKSVDLKYAVQSAADGANDIHHQGLLPGGIFKKRFAWIAGFHHLMEQRFKDGGKLVKMVSGPLAGGCTGINRNQYWNKS